MRPEKQLIKLLRNKQKQFLLLGSIQVRLRLIIQQPRFLHGSFKEKLRQRILVRLILRRLIIQRRQLGVEKQRLFLRRQFILRRILIIGKLIIIIQPIVIRREKIIKNELIY